MTVIESRSYADTRSALRDDPVIQEMAKEIHEDCKLKPELLASLTSTQGPRWEFMQRALNEYHARGGKVGTHIGGPAEAILELLNSLDTPHGERIHQAAIKCAADTMADGNDTPHLANAVYESRGINAAIASVLNALLEMPSQLREDAMHDLLDRTDPKNGTVK